MNIVWFKSDLRSMDNPALYKSMQSGQTVAVYFLTMKQWQKHGISPAKQSLLIRQLMSLRQVLQSLNVPLLVLNVGNFDGVRDKFRELVEKLEPLAVFWNKEHELNERRLESDIKADLRANGITAHASDESCIVPVGRIVNQKNEPYKVFTAFKKAMIKDFYQLSRELTGKPIAQMLINTEYIDSAKLCLKNLSDADLIEMHSQLGLREHYNSDVVNIWPAGEDLALERLSDFIRQNVSSYDTARDFPASQSTSRLSPYLAVGAISTRQCLQEALIHRDEYGDGLHPGGVDQIMSSNTGLNAWVNELIWRDFYRHLLHWFPDLCKFKPFKSETDQLNWSHDIKLFQLWKEGRTGYPIVDAGMRELNETGWMHNRVRMITAMFLTKHLFIDWRWGEAYFMSKLIDGDLASNNGGWQWSASTGVDAAPYFRIFNPVRQSERFDVEGEYIQTHIPELRALDAKSIHMPSAVQALECGYVLPLVNHREATERTKLAFSNLGKKPFSPDPIQVAAL